MAAGNDQPSQIEIDGDHSWMFKDFPGEIATHGSSLDNEHTNVVYTLCNSENAVLWLDKINGNNEDDGNNSGQLVLSENTVHTIKPQFTFEGGATINEHQLHKVTVNSMEHVRVAFNKLQMKETDMELSPMYEQDKDGDTLLHIAVILRESGVALKLISLAPDTGPLDINNNLLQTPLHLAVLTNQLIVVRQLICADVSLYSRDRDGNTPLHIACREKHVEIVESLLSWKKYDSHYDVEHSRDADQFLELKNYHGETALHLAGNHINGDILRLLIKKGADVNAVFSKTGNTIVHEAALSGNVVLVKLLLSNRNCNINARAFDGSTPFDLARARRQWDVVRLLAVAGAKLHDDFDC